MSLNNESHFPFWKYWAYVMIKKTWIIPHYTFNIFKWMFLDGFDVLKSVSHRLHSFAVKYHFNQTGCLCMKLANWWVFVFFSVLMAMLISSCCDHFPNFITMHQKCNIVQNQCDTKIKISISGLIVLCYWYCSRMMLYVELSVWL